MFYYKCANIIKIIEKRINRSVSYLYFIKGEGVGSPAFVVFGIVVFPQELYAFILFEFGVCFEEFYTSFLEDIGDFFKDNGGNALPLIVGVYPDEVEIRPIVFPSCLQEMPPSEREELAIRFLQGF